MNITIEDEGREIQDIQSEYIAGLKKQNADFEDDLNAAIDEVKDKDKRIAELEGVLKEIGELFEKRAAINGNATVALYVASEKANNVLSEGGGETDVCETCGGDGVETCDNPDHGFIGATGGDIGRLGCPCCGHDPDHKIRGSKCPDCNGTGHILQGGGRRG